MHDPHMNRLDRLKKVNDILAEYRLPPWTDAHLGDLREGQCEIDMIDLRELGPRRIELTFNLRDPLGNERQVAIRFGGVVVYVVPLLTLLHGEDAGNGPMLCLAKRWRIEHGEWSLELPHALVAEDDLGHPLDPLFSPSHVALASTFGDVSTESLAAAKIVPLGTFRVRGEARPAEAYLFLSTVLRDFVRRKGDGSIVKLAWGGIAPVLENGKHLTEPVTEAALLRALRKYPPQK